MKCPSCGCQMDKVMPDCSGGCCGVSDKPYWLCPNCGRVEEAK
jgi:hypothetical protein